MVKEKNIKSFQNKAKDEFMNFKATTTLSMTCCSQRKPDCYLQVVLSVMEGCRGKGRPRKDGRMLWRSV